MWQTGRLVNFSQFSRTGQSLPFYGHALDAESQLHRVFAKVAGKRTKLRPQDLFLELLGTLVARELGLQASDPWICEIDPAIVRHLNEKHDMRLSSHYAFALATLDKLVPFRTPTDIGPVPDEVKSNLLALDLVLLNSDRVPKNPNVSWFGGELLIYDFGAGLILNLNDSEVSAEIHSEALQGFVGDHLFGSSVAGPALRQSLEEVFAHLAPTLGAVNLGQLPPDWQVPAKKLTDYLTHLCDNPTILINHLP